MLKIIAGKHKGRIIPTLKSSKYRPSTGKFREAIFSIITSGDFIDEPVLEGANVLDLFAGTGSLAFEALSRGAASVTLIDNIAEYLQHAEIFAERIGESNNVKILCMNACALPKALYQYDLIFMDPPYHQNFAGKALKSLIKGEWLKPNVLIIIEVAKQEDLHLSSDFQIIKQRVYGNNKLYLLRRVV